MNQIVIIGGGYSSFVIYQKLIKFNPLVITNKNINYNNSLFRRRNLQINKFFSKKSSSFGSLQYKLNGNSKIHDKLILGGNSNLW